eukprot:11163915-Lingulodinium_polyedra.AAC.1
MRPRDQDRSRGSAEAAATKQGRAAGHTRPCSMRASNGNASAAILTSCVAWREWPRRSVSTASQGL